MQATNPDIGELLQRLQNNGKTGDQIQSAVVREAKRCFLTSEDMEITEQNSLPT